MPTIVDLNLNLQFIWAILEFMSSLDFMLNWVEHEKSFITSGPGLNIAKSYKTPTQQQPDKLYAISWQWGLAHKNLALLC